MDRSERTRLRAYIGKHVDITNARLTDYDVTLLLDFIDNYEEVYKGKSLTRRRTFTGWSSDGKYTRTVEQTDTFTEDIGIHHQGRYHDDDGESGEWSEEVRDARSILNWLKENG